MKKNRIFSLILIVTMFFSLYTQSGVAAEDSVAAFDVAGFEYCDASGNSINTLTANGVVKATANIKRLSGSTGATLMLMAYDNGKLIQLSSDVADFSGDNEDNVATTITMPANVSKVQVMAYIWDSALGMEPISAGAIFGSSNADIISVTVGGVEISSFDENNTATVILPASASSNPGVKAICADLATKVVPTYGENTVTLTATAHSGARKVYTIKYTRTEAKLTNVAYTSDATYTETTTEAIKLTKANTISDESAFFDETTGDYTKSFGDAYGITSFASLEDYVAPNVSNRYPYWYILNIPSTFAGLNAIAVPYNNDTVYAGNDTVTFTTNKSVRFYVSSNAGWTDTSATDLGSFTFKPIRDGNSTAISTAYSSLKTTANNQAYTTKMFSYDVAVAEGGAPVTATIKVRAADTWAFPNIYYEFIDNDEVGTPVIPDEPNTPDEPEPDEPEPDEPSEPDVPDVPDEPVVIEGIDDAIYSYSDLTELTQRSVIKAVSDDIMNASDIDTLSTAIGSQNIEDLKEHVTLAWTDRGASFFWDVPDELIGKTYIPIKYYAADGGNYASANYITFNFVINKNVRIWYSGMDWNNRNIIKYLGTDLTSESDDVAVVGVTKLASLAPSTMHIDNNGFTTITIGEMKAEDASFKHANSKSLYTADLILPDGQETAAYQITAAVDAYTPMLVAYEILEDDALIPLEVSATINGADYNMAYKAMNAVYSQDTETSKWYLGATPKSAGAAVWNVYANRLDTSGYTYIHKLPEEVEGAYMGCWAFASHGNKPDSGVSTITLTVNRTATLYFSATEDYATESGAELMDSGIATLIAGNYYNCTEAYAIDDPNVDGNTNFHDGKLYKLTLEVPAGQESATFEIPLAWCGDVQPIVFIK